MADLPTISQAFHDLYSPAWATARPLFPLYLDNEEFTPPSVDSRVANFPEVGSFSSLNLNGYLGQQITFGRSGAGGESKDGLILINLGVPKGTGSGLLEDLDAEAIAIVNQISVSGVDFFVPDVVRVGVVPSVPTHFQHQISVTWMNLA